MSDQNQPVQASIDADKCFPIRVLSERTGVGHSTLRAWERRYQLLKPHRTPKGHRLYCEEDVKLIERVLVLLSGGQSISRVSRLLKEDESSEGQNENDKAQLPQKSVSQQTNETNPWHQFIQRLLQAVEDFNLERLDTAYNEAASLYPIELISSHLIVPTLKCFDDRWKHDKNKIAQEHFFSAWLRNKLGARINHSISMVTGAKLLVCCTPGYRHEVGALLFSLTAMGRGYRVVYLGADMPLAPLPTVIERSGAKAVVLAAGDRDDYPPLLEKLSSFIQTSLCPVFVGGQLSVSHHKELNAIGATPLGEQMPLAMHLVSAIVPVHGKGSKFLI